MDQGAQGDPVLLGIALTIRSYQERKTILDSQKFRWWSGKHRPPVITEHLLCARAWATKKSILGIIINYSFLSGIQSQGNLKANEAWWHILRFDCCSIVSPRPFGIFLLCFLTKGNYPNHRAVGLCASPTLIFIYVWNQRGIKLQFVLRKMDGEPRLANWSQTEPSVGLIRQGRGAERQQNSSSLGRTDGRCPPPGSVSSVSSAPEP